MDVLLSLPILSYFAAPALSSWSTSLNLLFFYMTWSTLVLSHSPLKIELVGTLAVRVVFWLLPSLLFLLFDAAVPSLSEQIKIEGARSLPRRNAAAQLRRLLLAAANLVLVTAVQAGLSLAASRFFFRGATLFKTSTTLPLPWQMIKNIAWLYTSREVLTYYIHRFVLHSGQHQQKQRGLSDRRRGGGVVGLLTRLHGTYGHGAQDRGGAPYALMLYADHPLPFLLQRTLPVYLPCLVVRPHLLTYFLFTILTTLEETASMSGYSVVPGILLGGIARRTAAHYASGGRGNYGAWGLLDWASGTSVGKDLIEDLHDEADKHRLKERGEAAAGDASNLLQDGIENIKKSRRNGRKKN
ncbi:hypothetical protein BX600DRAFT_442178 [Xylariales sp. PMI_506]|nr:hypothetical protein BX600DRAFT_442178 [Xylariales sp. PMI_506]